MFACCAMFRACEAFSPVVFVVDVLSVCCLVSFGRSRSIRAGSSALLCWAGVCCGRLLFLTLFFAPSSFYGDTRLISAMLSLMGKWSQFVSRLSPRHLGIQSSGCRGGDSVPVFGCSGSSVLGRSASTPLRARTLGPRRSRVSNRM